MNNNKLYMSSQYINKVSILYNWPCWCVLIRSILLHMISCNNINFNMFQNNKIWLEKLRQPSKIIWDLDIFSRSNLSHSLQRPHHQKPPLAVTRFSGGCRGGAGVASSTGLLITRWKLGSWLPFICSFIIHSSHLEHCSGIQLLTIYIYIYRGNCLKINNVYTFPLTCFKK